MQDNTDFDPTENELLAALPRHRQPGQLLEERTVRALRSRGLLRDSRRNAGWWTAAAAAAIAFFVTGFAAGQRSAGNAFAETTVETQQLAMQTALQVQRTGSAWIAALTSLAELAGDGDDDAVRQGREAARAALYAAAVQFAGIEPADPVSAQLLWLLADPAPVDADADSRAVVWF